MPMAAFDDDARRWARTALGMSAGDDARFALLQKVKASGFNLPADVGVAFRVVSRPGGDLGDVGRILESAGFGYERDQKRRQAVDGFAELFFTLPSAERGVRFQSLRAECDGDPLLENRLARLGRGLEIDLDRDGLTAPEERVVSIVRELFPLSPEERATRRRELVREVGRDRPFDVKTLDRLRMSWSALARLDPELWRQLESAVAGWQPRRLQPVIERAPAAAPAPPPLKPAPQANGPVWWHLIWILVVVGGGLLRACSAPVGQNPNFRPAMRFDDAEQRRQRELFDEFRKQQKREGIRENGDALNGIDRKILDDVMKRQREKKDAGDANK
jgi:hypothetical protein